MNTKIIRTRLLALGSGQHITIGCLTVQRLSVLASLPNHSRREVWRIYSRDVVQTFSFTRVLDWLYIIADYILDHYEDELDAAA